MENKIKIYSPIKEEVGVVMLFAKLHEKLGFPKLVSSSARGFDIENIEYHDEKGIHRVVIEFEYLSSNFILHGHQNDMKDDKKYIVVCWEDDCNLKSYIKEKYKKDLYKVIELNNYVEIKPDNIIEEEHDIKYYLINYNSKEADYTPFSAWRNANMYRFKNNNNIKITDGSKALFKQGNYIIGGFDIVRFKNIKLPNNNDTISIYKTLTDYPVDLFVSSPNEIKSEYVNNNIGHIFYNNFFELSDKNLRRTVKEILPDLGISNAAVQTLTEEQYNKLLGQS